MYGCNDVVNECCSGSETLKESFAWFAGSGELGFTTIDSVGDTDKKRRRAHSDFGHGTLEP